MADRITEVFRKSGVSIDDIQSGDEPRSLVFNLQKIAIKSAEYVKTLWLFGVDRNGYSVSVAVQDFSPTFMIRSPDMWSDNELEAVDDLDDLIADINEQTKGEGTLEKIKSAEFVMMTPFIGFTNQRKDRLIKFICRNINDAAIVIKHMESRKFTLYHEDFKPANQFLQQTGIEYQTWVEIKPIRYNSSRMTHTSLEGYCTMEDVHKYSGEIKLSNLPLLKAFVRMKPVSRDAMVMGQPEYRYNPDLPCDRLVAIGVYFSWHQDHTTTPFKSVVHTIIPGEDHQFHSSEKDMLEAFRANIVAMDPDEIYFFPDEFPMWEYYASRVYNQFGSSGNALRLERFKTSKMRAIKQNGVVTIARFETRNIFNMEAALQKKVFISVESYDLYTCSCHSAFRKDPCKMRELATDSRLVNRQLHKGPEGRRRILQVLKQDLDLLIALELDTSMSGEYSNVSKASDTDLTDVVSRGEQIRVFNRLMHFNLDNHMYVNREKLGQKPLKFRASERPPTFVDPDELELNTRLREECLQYLERKISYHNPKKSTVKKDVYSEETMRWFTAPDEDKDEDEDTKQHAKDAEEAEGGNVLKPSCRFWDLTRVCVWDFASLYPSIMMAFNLSYENLVFDEEFLDLPGIEYITVPINKYETVVSANVPGTIPKMLRTFVDNRKSIKKRMETETDPFRQKTLDFEQNSMKVLCNGTYGFTGAEKRGALLAMKPIMYMVTALGRYLQKFCSNHVGRTYNIPTIYGDTDSIFVLIGLPTGHETMTIDQIAEDMGRRYKMEGFLKGEPFTWLGIVRFYQTERKLDVTKFTIEHQINAIYYLISSKMTNELSEMIGRPPVKLEFENLADKVWMSNVKKNYCYRFWSEKDPSKVAKIKITGMAVKKREWSLWTRAVLMGVTERIMGVTTEVVKNKTIVKVCPTDRTAEIKGYIEAELDRLVSGQVPIRDLMVSKGFKNKAAYKHFRQIHLQIALKIEQRTRWPVKEKSRVYFVVLKGNDQLYLRSETPQYAEEHKLELDLSYYLNNQFYRPMKKLLTYHPEVVNFEELFKRYLKRLEMKNSHQIELTTESIGKHRRLDEADIIARMKARSSEEHRKLKKGKQKGASDTLAFSNPDDDPFARFLKK